VPVFGCGRLLYIDWHMVVVVGGNVLHHVKREGELSWRRECLGEYVGRKNIQGGNVLHSESGSGFGDACLHGFLSRWVTVRDLFSIHVVSGTASD